MIFFNRYNERGLKLKTYVHRYNLTDTLSPEVSCFPEVLKVRAGMGRICDLAPIAETIEASMPYGDKAVAEAR